MSLRDIDREIDREIAYNREQIRLLQGLREAYLKSKSQSLQSQAPIVADDKSDPPAKTDVLSLLLGAPLIKQLVSGECNKNDDLICVLEKVAHLRELVRHDLNYARV